MVTFFRAAAISFISVVVGFYIIELFVQGDSILLGIIPFIFPVIYSVCLITELNISWAEFKFFDQPVALPVTLIIGFTISIISAFFLPIISLSAIIGAIFYYLGRKIKVSTIINGIIIVFPFLLLIFAYPVL